MTIGDYFYLSSSYNFWYFIDDAEKLNEVWNLTHYSLNLFQTFLWYESNVVTGFFFLLLGSLTISHLFFLFTHSSSYDVSIYGLSYAIYDNPWNVGLIRNFSDAMGGFYALFWFIPT